ncbi:hypothetical protein [Nostoc sp.]
MFAIAFGTIIIQGVIIFFEVWHDLNILSDRFAYHTELHLKDNFDF